MCHGLDRSVATAVTYNDGRTVLPPGIIQVFANPCRDGLLKSVWKELVTHLGGDGFTILTTLFLDCGLFVRLNQGIGNFRQLSGLPIHDLDIKTSSAKQTTASKDFVRRSSEIKFARHRILYGRPALNGQENVFFGFGRIHILNRLSQIGNHTEDVDLMKYVFPRQFKLHNVFTFAIDRRETAQQFKDYTSRDDEINRMPPQDRARLPRRLRGQPCRLIARLRRLHQRCSYPQLMYHYCPLPFFPPRTSQSTQIQQHNSHTTTQVYQTQIVNSSTAIQTTPVNTLQSDAADSSLLPYATSPDRVSAFCRSALLKLVPGPLLGVGREGRENWRGILCHVDRFVQMRKFESLNLHEVVQGLKVKSIEWLKPEVVNNAQKSSITDTRKREELLQEFVYYLFDSLLIPLLSSNFYITESGVHRNRLLYFRHDVWERLCQPTLESWRIGALVRLPKAEPRSQRQFPELGFSTVRFLPKGTGTRPITNLRRRAIEIREGRRILGPSTNERLAPVFSIFNFERQGDDGVFRSDSFSLQTLGERLSDFKARSPNLPQEAIYFVKVDIQSAFDSIPQEKLLQIVDHIFKHDRYYGTHHAEGRYQKIARGPTKTHAAFRFTRSARGAGTGENGIGPPVCAVDNKRHIVFSDVSRYKAIPSEYAKSLLQQHVQHNVIKLGRDLYRKTEGIAQGSILSNLLCTFFYNEFEIRTLGFLDDRRSVLLRIMDDFLLITLDRADALRFMLAMKAGDADYGIHVHPEKSLVNFDMVIDGVQVPKLTGSHKFPFCGLFIDTATLEISKNRVRRDNTISNSLTVDLHGQVGVKFQRRVLSSLRIQLQRVLLNHGLNDRTRIVHTIVESVQETAMKMHQYYSNMPAAKRPSAGLLIEVIRQLMHLTTRMVFDSRHGRDTLTQSQIHCLVAVGLMRVLRMKSSHYPLVVAWLERIKAESVHSLNMTQAVLSRLVDSCFESVQHYRF